MKETSRTARNKTRKTLSIICLGALCAMGCDGFSGYSSYPAQDGFINHETASSLQVEYKISSGKLESYISYAGQMLPIYNHAGKIRLGGDDYNWQLIKEKDKIVGRYFRENLDKNLRNKLVREGITEFATDCLVDFMHLFKRIAVNQIM